MEDVEELLAKAAQSRRLARDATDLKVSGILNTMAEEFEAKAASAIANARQEAEQAQATDTKV